MHSFPATYASESQISWCMRNMMFAQMYTPDNNKHLYTVKNFKLNLLFENMRGQKLLLLRKNSLRGVPHTKTNDQIKSSFKQETLR